MIEFLKVRDVKDPCRKVGDAGIDFFIPSFSEELRKEIITKNPNSVVTERGIKVEPGYSVFIPSGIKCKFSENIALEAANKSSIATKYSLIAGAEIVDASYQGEVYIHLINVGHEPSFLCYGQKVIQFIPTLISIEPLRISTDEDNFYNYTTERGSGGFGSTGEY
jgi:dUTP diphosphatase